MDLESIPVVALLAMAVSLFALWRTERMQHRTRKAELFQLQQTVLLKIEAARTEWCMLAREIDTLMHRLAMDARIGPEERTFILYELQKKKEKIDKGKAQAAAFADDIFANVKSYDEQNCRNHLHHIEVSIEKLRRNQGELERQFTQDMEQAAAHSGAV